MTLTNPVAKTMVPANAWAAVASATTTELADRGYARWAPPATAAALAKFGPATSDDWPAFAASWNNLVRDSYMGDGGRYRLRRHATYAWSAGGSLELAPHGPHYQSREYNALNGGIARWFEPVEPTVAGGTVLTGLIRAGRALIAPASPMAPWHIEVHQFRITAEDGAEGRPTPEGVHRDGVDYVMVMMVHRENIASGRTELFDNRGSAVSAFTLTDPGELVILDDRRLAHGVTPVTRLEAGRPSYRDVLVITFRAAGGAREDAAADG